MNRWMKIFWLVVFLLRATVIGTKSQLLDPADCTEKGQQPGFWVLLVIIQILTALIVCGVVLMLFMLAISLTTIKRFQTK